MTMSGGPIESLANGRLFAWDGRCRIGVSEPPMDVLSRSSPGNSGFRQEGDSVLKTSE